METLFCRNQPGFLRILHRNYMEIIYGLHGNSIVLPEKLLRIYFCLILIASSIFLLL